MDSLFNLFGAWTWFIIAAVLMIGELLVPGVFLVWLGLAGAVVGVVHMLVDLGWQVETVLFGILSVIFVIIGRRYMRNQAETITDQPNLNRRINAYMGREYVLREPIVDGAGRLNIDDTLWKVKGPDLANGSKVRVIAIEGMTLVVEPAVQPSQA